MILNKLALPTLIYALEFYHMNKIDKKECIQSLDGDRDISKFDTEDARERNNVKKIFEMAFRNLGLDCQLVIEFDKQEGAELNAGLENYIKVKAKPVAFIVVEYAHPSQIRDVNTIYAIAGHEAAHALHRDNLHTRMMEAASTALITNHLFKQRLKANPYLSENVKDIMCLLFGLSLDVIAKKIITGKINQKMEKNADVTAAEQLDTAQEFINFLAEDQKQRPHRTSFWEKLTSDHPSNKKRIRYLTKIEKEQALYRRPILA